MKTDREKGRDILEKREEARKGVEPEKTNARDPLKVEKKKEEKAGELAGIAIGAGFKRSG